MNRNKGWREVREAKKRQNEKLTKKDYVVEIAGAIFIFAGIIALTIMLFSY